MCFKWLVLCYCFLAAAISSASSNAIACENNSLKISCPKNNIIRIKDALYGRQPGNLVCGKLNKNCRAKSSLSVVKNYCEGKTSCVVPASNSVFRDPCVGVNKYLWVDYYCHTNNPCQNYMEEDDWQRSTGYIVPKGSPSKKGDRPFTAGWYRFISGAGGEMPTSCPPERACGATGPVWLDGKLPKTVGDQATLKACVRVSKICCASVWSVDVKKCSKDGKDFFVYNLKATPGHGMSYCAGTQTKCPNGETSATGFTPCSSKFPKLAKDPVVSVGVHNSRLRFTCKFDPRDKGDNVRHEVTWYSGPPEKKLKTETLKGSDGEAYLQNKNSFGEKPTFCLNKNIYCVVGSYYKDQEQFKNKRKSNEFFAGFKINPKTVTLSENGKPQKITVETTVPIVCQDGTEHCRVRLEIGQTKTDNFVDFCTLQFKPGAAGQKRELEVVAKRDFVDDGDQSMKVKLFVPQHIDPVDWNCYENITDITVKTTDVKTARCTSTGDPHLTTFDRFYYNHFHIGDYVLVNSTARRFEAHLRTFRCHTVSCNCGIAVREGDDVIVVDMCRDNVPRARFASTVEPQKGTSIERSANGKTFVLNFPSGAFVRFEAKKWFSRWYYANIVVQLPSDDYGQTKGLCGIWDKSKANDLTSRDGKVYKTITKRQADTRFSESWKLKRDESLFYYTGGPRKCLATRAKSYCTCSEACCGDKRRVNCDFEGYSTRPKYIQQFKGWKKLEFPGAENCGRKRRRRAIDNDVIILPDDGDTGIYEYDPKQEAITISTFPTKSGTTQQKATDECDKALRNSDSGKACLKTIPTMDISDFKEQCILDVQVLDDIKVATESAVGSFADACEEITLREVSKYWKADSAGKLEPPSAIGDSNCPNECSGSGSCMNATCVCNKGYISSDCSIKEGEAPVMIHVPFDGLCDIRKQDCVRTRVVGYNFIESSKLACRSTEVIVSNKPYVKTGIVNVRQSQLLSFAELTCDLPKVPVDIQYGRAPGKPVGGFLIELSNDGKSFSQNSSLFLVYDSKCMECTKQGDRTCKWKGNTCKINNYCFAPGEANPDDWCQICDPTRRNTTFVKRLVNVAPVVTPPNSPILVFKGQNWKFEVNATDEEKQPLSYQFVGEAYGMDISSAGIITWFPQEVNKTYEVTVKATDPCGKSATGKFVIETRQCKCEGMNGGICEWNVKSGSVCKCPDGCHGATCKEAMEGRVCKIHVDKTSKDDDDGDSSTTTIVIVVIVVVLLAISCGVVFYLYKQGHIFKGDSTNDTKVDYKAGQDAAGGGVKVPTAVREYEDKMATRTNNAYVTD